MILQEARRGRQEVARQEVRRQEVASQEVARQEVARQEVIRQEMARQEARGVGDVAQLNVGIQRGLILGATGFEVGSFMVENEERMKWLREMARLGEVARWGRCLELVLTLYYRMGGHQEIAMIIQEARRGRQEVTRQETRQEARQEVRGAGGVAELRVAMQRYLNLGAAA